MVAALAKVSARMGRLDEARTPIAELLARAEHGYVPPFSIAKALEAVGDIDAAMAWLTRSYNEGSNAIVYLGADSLSRSWRNDPRFHALLAAAGPR